MTIDELKPIIRRLVNQLVKENMSSYETTEAMLTEGYTRHRKDIIIENLTKVCDMFLEYSEEASDNPRFIEFLEFILRENDRYKEFEKLTQYGEQYVCEVDDYCSSLLYDLMSIARENKAYKLKKQVLKGVFPFFDSYMTKIEEIADQAIGEKNNDKLKVMGNYLELIEFDVEGVKDDLLTKKESEDNKEAFDDLIKRMVKLNIIMKMKKI